MAGVKQPGLSILLASDGKRQTIAIQPGKINSAPCAKVASARTASSARLQDSEKDIPARFPKRSTARGSRRSSSSSRLGRQSGFRTEGLWSCGCATRRCREYTLFSAANRLGIRRRLGSRMPASYRDWYKKYSERSPVNLRSREIRAVRDRRQTTVKQFRLADHNPGNRLAQ